MARRSLACVLAVLAVTSAAKESGRWSRQISSYTSDLTDWVPLPGPGPIERDLPRLPQIKRQAVAEPRILAEPVFPGFQRPTGFNQDFPARAYYNSAANRQLYLQSVPAVPSAPQNYLTDQGFNQGFRFGLAPQPTYLGQGFIEPQLKFESPNSRPQPPVISNPVSFPKPSSAPHKTFINQGPKKIDSPKFVDGYRVESDVQVQKKPQSLQKLKYDSFESAKLPKTEMVPPRAKSEREEVQLLYVPLESLNKGQFNFRKPLPAPPVLTPNYAPIQRPVGLNPVQQKHTFDDDIQKPLSQPIDSFSQEFIPNFNSFKEIDQTPKFSTITSPFPNLPPTTPKPKKLKPHQPPLAIFLTQEAKKGRQVKVGDVLSSLKNAESVAVLDSVNPQTAPKVFIGPSNLSPPENYVKFDLPYLSNIDHSDRKLRQLPFFVAPLSYKTPQGFAKIPFPSPHVGSVVINSQIKEDSSNHSPPAADVIPNSYTTSPQSHAQQQTHKSTSPTTKRPTVSFFTTDPPRTNSPLTHKSNYYSFEPQTVSTVRPPQEPQKIFESNAPPTGTHFLNNYQGQYPDFDVRDSFKSQEQYQINDSRESVNAYSEQTKPTTPSTTVSSTTTKATTYPNQLLETHNPFSINQAFHFSTPLDYHNLFDENYATPDSKLAPPPSKRPQEPQYSQEITSPAPTVTPKEPVTEKTYQQSSPNYYAGYSPEIQYQSELNGPRYEVSNSNEYTPKPEYNDYSQSTLKDNNQSVNNNPEYNNNYEPQIGSTDNTKSNSNEQGTETTVQTYLNSQYDTSYETEKQTSPTPTTTTTTTRKSIIRNRGRPRYTTPKADSGESTTRTVVTRRPVKERRPLPLRPRYEPNKITTERATRKPVDSNESTTKYSRGRTRGRIQYKPTESDDYYGKQKQSSKEQDLAYQRDVLHQNYPVTLMERSSTVDIEAITEPIPKISSTKVLEPVTETYDTENAYSYEKASISQHRENSASKEESYTPRAEPQAEQSPTVQPYYQEDYSYSKTVPVDSLHQYEESLEQNEETNGKHYVTSTGKSESAESSVAVTEQSPSSISISDLSSKTEEITTVPDYEITKLSSKETTHEEETEANVVQTTPSYNRVRVRPGVIRQYHQSSSAESTKTKTRKPSHAVTYRPAFDRRRTTMRIEEIEADLKTKQVHSRAEFQDHRHPVYRPDATTESTPTGTRQETTTVRGVFRRRRPVYTTTSTETSASSSATTKRTYDAKNRFRGRRPTTERATTEKAEIQNEPSTTTTRTYSRYTRPRLSERYNKKPEPEESEDQDSNYSINRPKYVEAETEQWSPKQSTDSFKPYNPNEISDDKKATTPQTNDEQDIITADTNDYEDILLTVTPASNNKHKKNNIPEIPPTLEALVEQSKSNNAKNDSDEKMSTFQTMLEEVMKSLEEQDENEYSTHVQKHKGGEIGEIPPEKVITSEDSYKTTTVEVAETTTIPPSVEVSTSKEADKKHQHRRGFWKKVKVRPVTKETIEAAESQYYASTVNQLGEAVQNKHNHDKTNLDRPKVTTYKPAFNFFDDLLGVTDDDDEVLPTIEIEKIKTKANNTAALEEETTKAQSSVNPGELDLGTGSPDPTIDNLYTTTEPTTKVALDSIDRDDGFSFMDYLFGAIEGNTDEKMKKHDAAQNIQITTEQAKASLPTTESTFLPDEFTSMYDELERKVPNVELGKLSNKTTENKDFTTEKASNVESSSISSFMDPTNVISTSMSTEISHETEICFRGKCIKTSKDVL